MIVSQVAGESLSIAQQRSKVVWSEARLATQGMLDDRGREGENSATGLRARIYTGAIATAGQLQPPFMGTLADLARLLLSCLGLTLQARTRAREIQDIMHLHGLEGSRTSNLEKEGRPGVEERDHQTATSGGLSEI